MPSQPSPAPAADQILITVTGRDRPGVTSTLMGILADKGAALANIDQVVVHGQLTLCLLVELPESTDVLKEMLFAAKQLGMNLDFKPVDRLTNGEGGARGDAGPGGGRMFVITAIGRALGPAGLHAIASTLAHEGANIERISRLSEAAEDGRGVVGQGELASVEIHARLPGGGDAERLKRLLLAAATAADFDVSLQRESLFRRSKRLVVMDMDSTLIRIEVIDELARAHGVGPQVAAITERAMHGEMNYDESLRQRVALLQGLDVEVLDRIAAELPLTDGAEILIRVLKRLGYRIAVLSGGFSRAADALKRRLGLDYAFSNQLEIRDGKLTGKVTGPIVNAERKAELLDLIAQLEGVLLDQVIAVGDGANDALMLEKAGLGIAFHAKPMLREKADTAISASGLDAILYLLGLTAREIREIA